MQLILYLSVGLFGKSGRFYTHIPQLGKVQIPAPVLWLMGINLFIFFTLSIINWQTPTIGKEVAAKLFMPTDTSLFMQRPWTIFTSLFVHHSVFTLLSNVLLILFFGNLTSMLFSQRVVMPLFMIGGLISTCGIWIFKALPLTQDLLVNQSVGGASGGAMALVIISTFYMPEQMLRMYGVYPLKLKFIGRGMLLFAVACIFFKYGFLTSFLELGGALAGYIFLVVLKRNKLYAKPIPFLSRKRKVRQSAEVELNSNSFPKPLSDDDYNEIAVSKKEYLDHLLDKIGRHGMESLSTSEMRFLDKYSQE